MIFGDHDQQQESCDQNRSETSTVIKRQGPKTPTFLVQMRKRQQERAEKREEIRKFHEFRAEEKRRQAYEEESLRIQKEAEDKLTKRKKQREMIKQERLYQRLKSQEMERSKFLCQRAKTFHDERVKKRFGLEPWIQLIKDQRLNQFVAKKHHEQFLLKKSLLDWFHMARSNQIMRRVKAEEFQRQKLLTTSFGKWVEIQMNTKRKLQAAFDFNEMRLTTLIFKHWRALNDVESRINFKKDLKAIQHHRK